MVHLTTNTVRLLFLFASIHSLENLLTLLITGYGQLFDYTARLNLNDTFVNNLNFFWTSFTYLPTFFFAFLGPLYIILGYPNTLLLLIGFTLYNFELTDMIVANHALVFNDLNSTSVNLLLLNGLNKYHPFIFYCSVYLVLILFVAWRTTELLTIRHDLMLNWVWWSNSKLFKQALYFNFTALFMGSWWALQEGTWGGWWNWDPSEVFGLMFGLVALWLQHANFRYHLHTKLTHKFIKLFFVTILTYFFIQLNFDLVSHNFGSKFFFFFNNNLFFLESIVILTLTLISTTLNSSAKVYTLHHTYLPLQHSSRTLLRLTPALNLTLTILLGLSFLPLLNYFIWNYFGVNTFNGFKEYTNWVLLFVILLIAAFLNFSTYQFHFTAVVIGSLSVGIFYNNILAVWLFLCLWTRGWPSFIHFSLIYFLLLNSLSSSMDFILWYLEESCESLITNHSLISAVSHSYSCSNEFVYFHVLRDTETNNTFLTSGAFYSTNSLTLQPFLLLFNDANFTNLYNLSLNWINSNIYIESNNLNLGYDLVLLLLILQRIFLVL